MMDFNSTTHDTGSNAVVTYPREFFEKKFNALINSLGGSFKIKRAESDYFTPFYKMKVKCQTERFSYETIVIGDEYDDDDAARENVFWKAYNALNRVYGGELRRIDKNDRRKSAESNSEETA